MTKILQVVQRHAISHKSLQGSENAEKHTQKQVNSSTRLAEIKQTLHDWGLTQWSDDDWLFASVLRGQNNNLMSNGWANQLISYRWATDKEVEKPRQAKERQLDKWNRQAKSERANTWFGGPPALFALLCQPETQSPQWGIQWCTGLGGSVHSPLGGWGSKIVNWQERASGLVFLKPGWKRIMMCLILLLFGHMPGDQSKHHRDVHLHQASPSIVPVPASSPAVLGPPHYNCVLWETGDEKRKHRAAFYQSFSGTTLHLPQNLKHRPPQWTAEKDPVEPEQIKTKTNA